MSKKQLQHLGFVSNGIFLVQRDGEYFGPAFYLRLHEGLMRMFPEVTFYCFLVDDTDQERARDCTRKYDLPHLKICPLPLKGSKLGDSLGQLRTYWQTLTKPDVICIDMPNQIGFFAALVCRLRGQKYFVRVLGNWGYNLRLNQSANLLVRFKAALANWMERTVVAGADLALFQGQELLAKHAAQINGITKSDKVHSTLTTEMFFARQEKAFHTPLRIITVARLEPLKGLDVLLQALRILAEQGLEIEWWCVGDGPARASLEQLAQASGLAHNSKFLGYVPNGPELYRLYREADIFVLPSLTEGIAQALLEALAHSLPTVASAVGGIPGVITNNVHGLLVAPGDAQALAAGILKLATNPALATQLQQAGFARAQNFRADVLRQAFREMIETTFGRIGAITNP